jgi:hypothetical protein
MVTKETDMSDMNKHDEIDNQARQHGTILTRCRTHRLWRIHRWTLLCVLLLSLMTWIGWNMMMEYDQSVWWQISVGSWLFFVAFILDVEFDHYRFKIAVRLYFEDVTDGVCPDRGMQVTMRNQWRSHVKQGKLLWVSSKRSRPHVHVADAIAPLEKRDPPLRR